MGLTVFVTPDTDSIHCLLSIEELKQFCEIDDYKLGAWKHESSFERARFVRQKTYVEEEIHDRRFTIKKKITKEIKRITKIKGIKDIKRVLKITCAGLPKNCYSQVNFENFHEGLTVSGKLTFSHVKGGVILKETDFTIKIS